MAMPNGENRDTKMGWRERDMAGEWHSERQGEIEPGRTGRDIGWGEEMGLGRVRRRERQGEMRKRDWRRR